MLLEEKYEERSGSTFWLQRFPKLLYGILESSSLYFTFQVLRKVIRLAVKGNVSLNDNTIEASRRTRMPPRTRSTRNSSEETTFVHR